MKKTYILTILFVWAIGANVEISDPWKYIDFDVSMRAKEFPNSLHRTRAILPIDGLTLYNFFKELYQRNNLTALRKRGIALEQKIPKIIHQIWLGGPLPKALEGLCETWKQYHVSRGWFYKLWTDEDVPGLTMHNKKYFDAKKNPGVRSDLMRLEILCQFGGFYLDTDYECLQPLDSLLCYDFVTAIQPLDAFFVQLGSGFFGAHPEHPILKHCIETIKDDWHQKGAPKKTGPIHFTKSFYQVAGKNGKVDIALPPTHFYPLGSQETEMRYEKWLAEGAYAVHHWAKSWMPSRYRLKQFKELDNDSAIEGWND